MLWSKNFQNYTNKKFQTGGRATGAPALDPPLVPLFKPERFSVHIFMEREFIHVHYGAHGLCFALKSRKESLLHFTYLNTLGKVVIFPLITKFKTNRS